MKIYIDTETTPIPKGWSSECSPTDLNAFRDLRMLSIGVLYGDQEYYSVVKTDFEFEKCEWNDVTPEMAKNGKPITQIFDELAPWINEATELVGYNVMFDYLVVASEMHRYGHQLFQRFTKLKHDCVMKRVQEKWGLMYRIRLTTLYDKLFHESFPAHNALEDIRATKRCEIALLNS